MEPQRPSIGRTILEERTKLKAGHFLISNFGNQKFGLHQFINFIYIKQYGTGIKSLRPTEEKFINKFTHIWLINLRQGQQEQTMEKRIVSLGMVVGKLDIHMPKE